MPMAKTPAPSVKGVAIEVVYRLEVQLYFSGFLMQDKPTPACIGIFLARLPSRAAQPPIPPPMIPGSHVQQAYHPNMMKAPQVLPQSAGGVSYPP